MAALFYSQHGEDEWIANNLPLPKFGFYVDLGCAHPFTTSNTAFLRARRWEGLAVDGNPRWANEWRDIPGFCCSVISNDPEVLFPSENDNDWWARIGSGSKRSAETIEDCLDRHKVGKIDFLSVDVEGHEFDILRSLDFARHAPSIIVAEYNTAGLGEDDRIAPLLVSLGYQLRLKNQVNMIFSRV